MVIFATLFSPRRLNRDKCPFCGKELEYTSSSYDGDVAISKGFEKNVLAVNSSNELEIQRRVYKGETMCGTSYQHMICPRHKYEITRITTHRREWGKGWDKENQYEIMRYDYRVKNFGPKLGKLRQKQLESCCKNAGRDIMKTYKL